MKLTDLQIGQSIILRPQEGDTLEALWARLCRQCSRLKLTGRHFHRYKQVDRIFVQRVDAQHSGKLAPFLRLPVGEKMRCTDPFGTDREVKNLRRRLLYLAGERRKFIWLERHADGALYYRCYASQDEDWWPEHEKPVDDGSDFQSAEVVCYWSELRSAQAEFHRIKTAILANRAAASVL